MDKIETEGRIKAFLRSYPRGLTITRMASLLKVNRNLLARHLEVLEATGQVTSERIGPTRVFYLAHRVPASALLHLSNDMVCIFDGKGRVSFINDSFLRFLGLPREAAMGSVFTELFERVPGLSLAGSFPDLFRGEETTGETSLFRDGTEFHLKVKGIPTLFEDGTTGTTLLMEDVTKEREYVRELEFLAKTSAVLAGMGDEEDLYSFIADRIRELEPGSIVVVNSLDQEEKTLTMKAVAADESDLAEFSRRLGRDLVGISFPAWRDRTAFDAWSKRDLVGTPSLYHLFFGQVPEEITEGLERDLSLGRGYAIGCVCRGGIYGSILIKLKKGVELRHRETLMAFINQAAIALQRRHLKQKYQLERKGR